MQYPHEEREGLHETQQPRRRRADRGHSQGDGSHERPGDRPARKFFRFSISLSSRVRDEVNEQSMQSYHTAFFDEIFLPYSPALLVNA